MEAAGWIQRGLRATDKRANSIELREPARAALETARMLNDEKMHRIVNTHESCDLRNP